MVRGENSLFFASALDNSGLRSGASDAVGIIQGLGNSISKINPFAALAVGAISAFTIIANEGYKMAKAFESAMAEVKTIAGIDGAAFKNLGKDVIALSKALGTESPDKLAKGLYEIIGAGYEAADALKILETASKAATAGVTTSEVAADGLTTILNSFRLSAEDAAHVADIMFATVDRGKISFEELASQISTVAPLAASSGFGFEQIGAALSTLTKQGVPAGVAMTQIRSAIVAVNEVLGSDAGSKFTLQEALQKLYDQAGGDQNKLKELAGRIEAVGAVLAIAGPNFKGATEDLKAMGDAAGSVDKSFKIITDTTANQWEIFRSRIKTATIGLGDSILEMSSGAARMMNRIMEPTVDLTDKVVEQSAKFKLLKNEVESANTSFDRRIEILRQLKTDYPVYLQSLDLDKVKNEDLDGVLQSVKKSLQDINDLHRDRIELSGYQSRIGKATAKRDEYEILKNDDLQLFYSRVVEAQEFAERNGIELNVSLSDEPSKILAQIRKTLVTDKNDDLLSELFGEANSIVTRLDQANKGYQTFSKLAHDANNEINAQNKKLEEQRILLYDNAKGYKAIVTDIEKVDSLEGLDRFKDFKYEGIRDAVTARREIIGIIQEIDKATKTSDLSEYLKSENEQIKKAAEERAKFLASITGTGTDITAYKDFLEAKKKAYESHNKEMDALGKARAEEINKDLLKEGKDYGVFLKAQLEMYKGNVARERLIAEAAASAGFKIADRIKLEKIEVQVQPVVENIKVDTSSIKAIEREISKLDKERRSALTQGERDALKIKIDAKKKELEIAEGATKKEKELYKDVTTSIEGLTFKQLNDYIDYWREKLAIAKKGGNALAVAEAEGNISKGERQKWKNTIDYVAGSLEDVSQIFRNFGDDITADLIDGLKKVAGELDNLFKAMDTNATKGDRVSAGISGIVSLVGMVASASAQRKKAEEDYYLSVIGYQKQYNQLLNDQILARESANSNVFTFDYINELQTALEALDDAGVNYRKSLKDLLDGQAKLGQRNAVDWGNVGSGVGAGAAAGAAIGSVVPVIGTAIGAVVGGIVGGIVGIFGGKKKKDKFGSLLAEYPELVQQSADGQEEFNKELAQTLIDQNLVNDKTKLLLEDTMKWTDQLKEAREQIAGVIEALAGDLGNNLRNTLVTTFEQGGDAAEAMGETISQVLENILEQLIFDQIFSEQFKKLQKEMEKSFDIGGDSNWVDDFSRFFTASKNLTDDFNKAMQEAQKAGSNFGFDLFKGDGSKASGLAGAISTITEDTANILAGTLNSIRIDVANGLIIAQNSSVYLSQIAANTAFNKYLTHLQNIDTKMGNIETALNQFESRGL